MFEQPACRVIDHRLRGIETFITLPGLIDENLGSLCLQFFVQPSRFNVDGMDTRENLAALSGKVGPNAFEFGGTNDARAKGLSFKPLHDEPLTETVSILQNVIDFRFWH